ncbi:MAG TPA: hypothetical protein PLN34_05355 [Alloprevotella sp.]|nr:hypothetical protein [Alloprevotella sp.]
MTKKNCCLLEMPLSTTSCSPLTRLRRSLEASAPVVFLSGIYSLLLEEEVKPGFTLRLLHAQAAGLMLLFPAPLGLPARLVCLLWAALALRQCRNNNSNNSF